MKRFFALALVFAAAVVSPARAEVIFGLIEGNQLTTFNSATPNATSAPVAITGLRAQETIVGIDFRPATPGVLVGVGNVGGSGFIYTIDTTTGAATAINTSGFALSGSSFGVDFNPVPNALRIVSDVGQNLRITAGGAGVVNTDTTLTQTGIVAAAYTNSFAGTTVTTLYGLNAATGSLVLQGGINGPPSPNLGGITTVGSLGTTFTDGGFDVSGDTGIAYAVLNDSSSSGLYTVNLSSGAATFVGSFSGSGITDLAVQPVPAPAGFVLAALGTLAITITRRRRV